MLSLWLRETWLELDWYVVLIASWLHFDLCALFWHVFIYLMLAGSKRSACAWCSTSRYRAFAFSPKVNMILLNISLSNYEVWIFLQGKLCDVEQRQAYSSSCLYVGHYPSIPSLSIRNRTLRNYITDDAYHWKENL